MNQYKYILEPYNGMSTRYRCPKCDKGNKTFTLYIDIDTNEHLHTSVGRCNREIECGYHYTPNQYFQDNDISFDIHLPKARNPKLVQPQPKSVSFIPVEVFKASLKGHETNHFVKFLIKQFSVEITSELISKYFISTSKQWNGSTVFWQIDIEGKVRTGKIMLYDEVTGYRVKKPYNHIQWAHKVIGQTDFKLEQCLFGEHLLIDKSKPIAIVESEKTAIISSIYMPEFIWLATGGLSNLNVSKCSVLKGRKVVFFPDLKAYTKWNEKVDGINKDLNTQFLVSNFLELNASNEEKEGGYDIADYLVNDKEYKLEFTASFSSQLKEKDNALKFEVVHPALPSLRENANDFTYPPYFKNAINKVDQNWTSEIAELETFFTTSNLPNQPIRLNQCSTITKASLFVENHLAVCKVNNGKKIFLPYLNRLQEFKQTLINT